MLPGGEGAQFLHGSHIEGRGSGNGGPDELWSQHGERGGGRARPAAGQDRDGPTERLALGGVDRIGGVVGGFPDFLPLHIGGHANHANSIPGGCGVLSQDAQRLSDRLLRRAEKAAGKTRADHHIGGVAGDEARVAGLKTSAREEWVPEGLENTRGGPDQRRGSHILRPGLVAQTHAHVVTRVVGRDRARDRGPVDAWLRLELSDEPVHGRGSGFRQVVSVAAQVRAESQQALLAHAGVHRDQLLAALYQEAGQSKERDRHRHLPAHQE